MDMKKTAKKIIIAKFNGTPGMSEKIFDDQWTKLECGIRDIYNSKTLSTSLEELYRYVENLCIYKRCEFLYQNLCNLTESHFKNILLPLVTNEIDFLGTMNYTWVTLCRQIQLIKNIFLYLDRSFVLHNKRLPSIWCMSSGLFKEIVILNDYIRPKLVEGLLYLIHEDRSDVSIDRNLLKSLTSMLITLQIYDCVFKLPFIQATEVFYRIEGQMLIKTHDTVSYLRFVDRRYSEEENRVTQYINPYSTHVSTDILIKQLLNQYLPEILENSISLMITSDLVDEMTLLYKLVGFISPERTELCNAFSDYLKKRGGIILADSQNEKNVIQDLISFKTKIDNIVSLCFNNQEKFVNRVKESFKYCINLSRNKLSQLLAKFVDLKLRCKDLNEEEIESIINKVIVLFRFVQGKDVFEAFYKLYMAKRLLVGKSTSQDAENAMISKLKQECGGAFTAKLEGMFKDISISQGVNNAFRQYLKRTNDAEQVPLNIDMCVNVLTSSYWPNYPTYVVNLPHEMIAYQNIFTKFYKSNHSGRKLHWQPNLGHCIMKANFDNGKKELQVSLFQAIVLLLFNNETEMSYKDIRDQLNLEENELKRTLQSLFCGKAKVLIKTPRGKDIDENDTLSFNDGFTDRLFRVKINQIQMKETVEEQKVTERSVMYDRQFQIDAAIVRIMKQKKTLSHNLLISQLYNLLDMPVKPSEFKKRIEQLIDREYIERDGDNSTIYKYVA